MTAKRFGFKSFEISKTDKFLDEVKLYEIDKNHSDDLDESNLFYVYSTSEENIIQLVDKLNELYGENEQLQQELFESEYENICVHYYDNEVRRDDRIKDLKEEFKERFGGDFE